MSQVYSKVHHGQVIEFPVTLETIRARGHQRHNYTPVRFEEKPYYDTTFQKVSEALRVTSDAVIVGYLVQYKTLPEVLSSFKTSEGVTPFKEIPKNVVERVKTMVSDYIEQKIEYLAISKGYASLDRLLARYTTSNAAQFREEATFVQGVLDKAWADLLMYFRKIEAGVLPVPTTVDEINVQIQVATWPVK